MTRPSDLDVAALSPDERLDLIERLWHSLGDRDVPVTEAQRAELERRLAEHENDPARGVSWERLKAELRERFR